MSHSDAPKSQGSLVKVKAWAMGGIWTGAVVASIVWSLAQERRDSAQAALTAARAALTRDLAYGHWVGPEGRTAILLSEDAESGIPSGRTPERAVSLRPDGSPSPSEPSPPALLSVDSDNLQETPRSRLVSFRPIRPDNAPDEWESEALRTLSGGKHEVSSVTTIGGEEYFRLMRPLITRKGCLQCHLEAGYGLGDIMGGICVSVPMGQYRPVMHRRTVTLSVRHGLLWILGIAVIYMGALSLTQSDAERSRAEEAFRESEAKFHHIYENVPVMMISVDEQGSISDVNREWLAQTGYTREEVLGRRADFLMRGGDPGWTVDQLTPRPDQDGQVREFHCRYVRKDGTLMDVLIKCHVTRGPLRKRLSLSVVRDITEQQRAEAERKTFTRLGTRLAGAPSLESILVVIREESRRLLEWDACHFSLHCRTRTGFGVVSFVHTGDGTNRVYSSDDWPERELGDALRPLFEGRCVLIDRPTDQPENGFSRFGSEKQPSASMMFVPVRSGDKVIGVMSAQSWVGGRYSQADVQLFQRIADAAAPALERAYAEQALREQNEMLTFLNAVAQVSTGSLTPEEMCDRLLEVIRGAIPCDAFLVNFHKTDSGVVRSIRAYDTINGKLQIVSAPDMPFEGEGRVSRRVITEGKSLLIHREGDRPVGHELTPFGDVSRRSASLLFVPMVAGSRVIGLISTQSYTPKAYTQRDMELLEAIARQTGPAIEAAILAERLRQSEQRFRTVIETAADSIFMKNDSLQYTLANAAMEKLFGLEAANLIGKTDVDLFGPEAAERMEAVDRRVLKGETVAEQHTKPIQGKPHTFHVVKVPMRDKEGRVTGLCGIARDVSERKQLEDQLRQAAKMEAVGQLAGGIAHDFNNLLQGILGYASLIKLSARPATKVHQSADVIEKTADRACELTQQLLGFARRGKIQNIAVDLHETILQVIRLLSRTINKNISIVQNLRAKAAYVLGDPGQMQQVILNLAINARDAMPDGGTLTFETDVVYLDADYCRSHTGSSAGEHVVVSVGDNGRGIPKELHDRIFEPFFTTKEPGTGTGMGLAMVYGIVKNHGGTVRVYSEVGHGAIFKVHLPLAAGFSTPRSNAAAVAPIRGTGHILVIDDEEVVRSAVSTMLRRLGYQVSTASNGEEGVKVYQRFRHEIDLVIIDMIMPKMAGRETFCALKAINPNVRAILSTGYSLDGEAQKILDEGMVGFVQKPYRIGRLSEVVATAMRGVRAQSI